MTEGRRQGTCDAPHGTGCEFANAAADRAVRKTFAILGVDVDRPEQVRDFQESLRFGDKMRRAADRGALVFIGVAAAALAAALWLGIVTKIKGGP